MSAATGGRLRRALSRIRVRLLLFNVLLVFLPVAGLASLDAYEQHLLEQQERAMVQQGRLLAALLAGGPLDGASAQAVLDRLARTSDARLRVVDRDRRVLADSHRASAGEEPAEAYTTGGPARRGSWLYRAGAWLGRTWRGFTDRRRTAAGTVPNPPRVVAGAEIDAALAGRYGAATRLSPGGQRSLTLYGALPIRHGEAVTGAVLVSQSTFRILQRLYDVRLHMFEIVVVSLVAAAVLGLVTSRTIVRPLAHLQADAAALVDRRQARRRLRGTARHDEIGDLARALEEITARLDAHLRFTERFAADVSHEFRNPLASIRASSEMLAEADDAGDRERFHARITRDIRRLEDLLADVREVTAVDAHLEAEPAEALALDVLVRDLVASRAETDARRPAVEVHAPAGPLLVKASAERLVQVVTNLLDNAESFSPPGGRVQVELARDRDSVRLCVRDEGPGIPEEHAARVFDRFFSHRPGPAARGRAHAGLGLSIAKTIVERYGGRIRVTDHRPGAELEVTMPAAG